MNLQKEIVKSRLKQLLIDLKEAIAGTDQDFTTGKLGRAIFLLSVPMALEMLMESVFAVVDIFFVSKLGADAIATVGITESLLTLVYALGLGLGTAATSIISRRIGEKNPEAASVAAFQAILLGIGVSVVLAIPGIFYSRFLLQAMGASATIVDQMWGYMAVALGGNVVIMLLFIINAIFRSAGDAAISMRVLWIANLINIVLDPLLIFGIGPFPELGVTGAAVATTTGRGIAVIIQFYLLFRGRRRVALALHHLKPDWKVMRSMIKLSLGGIGQNIIATSSWIGLVRIISMFGSVVVAGYTIAIRIIVFVLLPSWGLSNAASTLTGQNLGANKPERAERAVYVTGLVNVFFLGIMGIILAVFSRSFVMLFTDSEPIISAGTTALRIISYGFAAYGFGMVMVNALNGAGDTATPMIINVFCFWLMEIPLAYLLAIPVKLEATGIFMAIVAAETTMTLVAWMVFRQGKWKTRKV